MNKINEYLKWKKVSFMSKIYIWAIKHATPGVEKVRKMEKVQNAAMDYLSRKNSDPRVRKICLNIIFVNLEVTVKDLTYLNKKTSDSKTEEES